MATVYLNGRYLPQEEAHISIEDRGFLFADGIYEVIRAYRGRLFRMEDHMARLRLSAAGIRLPLPDDDFPAIAQRLLQENGIADDGLIYMEITRGAAPRNHAFPAAGPPTVLVQARRFAGPTRAFREAGVPAVTVPDDRWAKNCFKTVCLLPNVLAKQKAVDAGAHEAIFVKDGVAIECSSNNLFAILDGVLVTYPKCNYILAGITRDVVLDLARSLTIPVREGAILVEDLFARASECFLTGTTNEVMPIVTVDGRPIGDGRPGPAARRLQEAFEQLTAG